MQDRYIEERGNYLGRSNNQEVSHDNSGAGIHRCCLQWGKWDECRTQGAQDGTSRVKSAVARLQERTLLRAEDSVEGGVADYLKEDIGRAFSRSVYQFNEVWREKIRTQVIEDSKDMDARNDKINTTAVIDSNMNAQRRMLRQLSKGSEQGPAVDEESGRKVSGLTSRGRDLDDYVMKKQADHGDDMISSNDECDDEYTNRFISSITEQRWCWADDWFSVLVPCSPASFETLL